MEFLSAFRAMCRVVIRRFGEFWDTIILIAGAAQAFHKDQVFFLSFWSSFLTRIEFISTSFRIFSMPVNCGLTLSMVKQLMKAMQEPLDGSLLVLLSGRLVDVSEQSAA